MTLPETPGSAVTTNPVQTSSRPPGLLIHHGVVRGDTDSPVNVCCWRFFTTNLHRHWICRLPRRKVTHREEEKEEATVEAFNRFCVHPTSFSSSSSPHDWSIISAAHVARWRSRRRWLQTLSPGRWAAGPADTNALLEMITEMEKRIVNIVPFLCTKPLLFS